MSFEKPSNCLAESESDAGRGSMIGCGSLRSWDARWRLGTLVLAGLEAEALPGAILDPSSVYTWSKVFGIGTFMA